MIRKAHALIISRLNEKTSVTQIARSLRVSREHLSRVFKEYAGISIQQFILQRKIRLACKLLKESNFSIKEISSRLGFSDQRIFT